MAQLLLRNVRAGKRRAAILDLESIAKKEMEKTLDKDVKPLVLRSFQNVVKDWKTKIKFQARRIVDAKKIAVYIYPVGPNKLIWVYVDKGTKPHVIRAKNKPRLAFMAGKYKPKTLPNPARTVAGGGKVQGGKLVRPVQVQHPGTEARNFTGEIAEDIKPSFKKLVEKTFRQIAKKTQE